MGISKNSAFPPHGEEMLMEIRRNVNFIACICLTLLGLVRNTPEVCREDGSTNTRRVTSAASISIPYYGQGVHSNYGQGVF